MDNQTDILLDGVSAGLKHEAYFGVSPISVLLLAALCTFTYWCALPTPVPGIPYNKGSQWKLFGDTLDFAKYATETGEGFKWMSLQCEKLKSPIVQVFMGPFQKPAICIADLQEIEDICMRRTKDFDRGGFLAKWFGLLVPDGTIAMSSTPHFKAQRSVWASTMTSQFLNTVSAPSIHAHTERVIELWQKKADRATGRAFNVIEDLRHAAFDIIWTAATGDDLGVLSRRIEAVEKTPVAAATNDSVDEAMDFTRPDNLPPIVEASATLVDAMMFVRSTPSLSVALWWTQNRPWYKKAWNTKDDAVKVLIAESRKRFSEASAGSDPPVRCAMDQVFKREYSAENKGEKATEREVIDETYSYIVGGHETTQDTLNWSLKFLTAHPDVQRKLHKALTDAWPGTSSRNPPTPDQIVSTDIPFLDAALQEMFRMAQTAPTLLRVTTRDTELLGHRIPRGTDVFGAIAAESVILDRDFDVGDGLRSASSKPKYPRWSLADKKQFRVERWLDADGKYDQYAGPSMPFGAGSRGCFGQRLARMELRIMIVLLTLAFEFKPIPEHLASFRALESITRGPAMAYIRPEARPA